MPKSSNTFDAVRPAYSGFSMASQLGKTVRVEIGCRLAAAISTFDDVGISVALAEVRVFADFDWGSALITHHITQPSTSRLSKIIISKVSSRIQRRCTV